MSDVAREATGEREQLSPAHLRPSEGADFPSAATPPLLLPSRSHPRGGLDASGIMRLQRVAGNRATVTAIRAGGPVLHRKRFNDAAVRAKAEEVSKSDDRGAVGNWSEGKIRLRAEEIFGESGNPDSNLNYFTAKAEIDRAWQERQKLSGGAEPAALDWQAMENGLTTDEFSQAVGICRDAFVAKLATSLDLAGTAAALKQQHAKVPALVAAADEALVTTRASKQVKEQFNQASAAATSKLMDPLKAMGTLAELTQFCEHVARIHGISPLNAIEDFVNDAAKKLPLQASTTPGDRSKAILDVQQRWDRAVAGPGGLVIPPQPVDPEGRLRAEKKPNVGPEARHAETMRVEGERSRQLVLGVGRPGDPQGYQDFAKDYGMWDYESWGAWNKESAQFPVAKQIDPNNGADVDTVLGAKDVNAKDIFEKLHFRLTGVFPSISGIRNKLVAAVALYNEKIQRGDDYNGAPINALWTLGEICTIAGSPQLRAKTAFYGDQPNEYVARLTDLVPNPDTDLPALCMPKITEFQQIGDRVATEIKRRTADVQLRKAAFKRVADTYFNIPRGYDFIMADLERNVANFPPP